MTIKSFLCYNCHHRYHQQSGLPKSEIINRKKHLIMKILAQYGINALKIASRNDFGVVGMPFLLYHLVNLGYLKEEKNQMGFGPLNDVTSLFTITDKGKCLIEKWF